MTSTDDKLLSIPITRSPLARDGSGSPDRIPPQEIIICRLSSPTLVVQITRLMLRITTFTGGDSREGNYVPHIATDPEYISHASPL